MKNISIFCGAHEGKNPRYAEDAKKIAEILASKGINIVFGGGNVGLMKIVSDTALDNGVEVKGISLESLHKLELANPRLKEIIITKTLLDRKDEFMKRSDAFIVLPGGVGSLDELAEIMANNQLGLINKPVGLLNTEGYYDHLIAWMKKAVEEGFKTVVLSKNIVVEEQKKDYVEYLRSNKQFDKTLIVLLTALNDEVSHIKGLELGGDDFINKPISPKVLVSRISALFRRIQPATTETKTIQIKDLVIDSEQYKTVLNGVMHVLAKKEFELLYLLAAQPGRVFLRNEILSQVWGNDVIVGDRTIDVHIRKIRVKLGIECITTVKGVGYKFDY